MEKPLILTAHTFLHNQRESLFDALDIVKDTALEQLIMDAFDLSVATSWALGDHIEEIDEDSCEPSRQEFLAYWRKKEAAEVYRRGAQGSRS